MVEEKRKTIVGQIDEAYQYLEKYSREKPASAGRCHKYCSNLVQLRKKIVHENEVDELALARIEKLLASILRSQEKEASITNPIDLTADDNEDQNDVIVVDDTSENLVSSSRCRNSSEAQRNSTSARRRTITYTSEEVSSSGIQDTFIIPDPLPHSTMNDRHVKSVIDLDDLCNSMGASTSHSKASTSHSMKSSTSHSMGTPSNIEKTLQEIFDMNKSKDAPVSMIVPVEAIELFSENSTEPNQARASRPCRNSSPPKTSLLFERGKKLSEFLQENMSPKEPSNISEPNHAVEMPLPITNIVPPRPLGLTNAQPEIESSYARRLTVAAHNDKLSNANQVIDKPRHLKDPRVAKNNVPLQFTSENLPKDPRLIIQKGPVHFTHEISSKDPRLAKTTVPSHFPTENTLKDPRLVKNNGSSHFTPENPSHNPCLPPVEQARKVTPLTPHASSSSSSHRPSSVLDFPNSNMRPRPLLTITKPPLLSGDVNSRNSFHATPAITSPALSIFKNITARPRPPLPVTTPATTVPSSGQSIKKKLHDEISNVHKVGDVGIIQGSLKQLNKPPVSSSSPSNHTNSTASPNENLSTNSPVDSASRSSKTTAATPATKTSPATQTVTPRSNSATSVKLPPDPQASRQSHQKPADGDAQARPSKSANAPQSHRGNEPARPAKRFQRPLAKNAQRPPKSWSTPRPPNAGRFQPANSSRERASNDTAADREENISPLDSIYRPVTKPKTGQGYGHQKFKYRIPKITTTAASHCAANQQNVGRDKRENASHSVDAASAAPSTSKKDNVVHDRPSKSTSDAAASASQRKHVASDTDSDGEEEETPLDKCRKALMSDSDEETCKKNEVNGKSSKKSPKKNKKPIASQCRESREKPNEPRSNTARKRTSGTQSNYKRIITRPTIESESSDEEVDANVTSDRLANAEESGASEPRRKLSASSVAENVEEAKASTSTEATKSSDVVDEGPAPTAAERPVVDAGSTADASGTHTPSASCNTSSADDLERAARKRELFISRLKQEDSLRNLIEECGDLTRKDLYEHLIYKCDVSQFPLAKRILQEVIRAVGGVTEEEGERRTVAVKEEVGVMVKEEEWIETDADSAANRSTVAEDKDANEAKVKKSRASRELAQLLSGVDEMYKMDEKRMSRQQATTGEQASSSADAATNAAAASAAERPAATEEKRTAKRKSTVVPRAKHESCPRRFKRKKHGEAKAAAADDDDDHDELIVRLPKCAVPRKGKKGRDDDAVAADEDSDASSTSSSTTSAASDEYDNYEIVSAELVDGGDEDETPIAATKSDASKRRRSSDGAGKLILKKIPSATALQQQQQQPQGTTKVRGRPRLKSRPSTIESTAAAVVAKDEHASDVEKTPAIADAASSSTADCGESGRSKVPPERTSAGNAVESGESSASLAPSRDETVASTRDASLINLKSESAEKITSAEENAKRTTCAGDETRRRSSSVEKTADECVEKAATTTASSGTPPLFSPAEPNVDSSPIDVEPPNCDVALSTVDENHVPVPIIVSVSGSSAGSVKTTTTASNDEKSSTSSVAPKSKLRVVRFDGDRLSGSNAARATVEPAKIESRVEPVSDAIAEESDSFFQNIKITHVQTLNKDTAAGVAINTKNAYLELNVTKYELMRSFKCGGGGECNFATDALTEFRKHLIGHKDKKKRSKKFEPMYLKCVYCVNDFKTPELLIQHVLTAHKNCNFQCPYCVFRACRPIYIKWHLELNHKDRNVEIYALSSADNLTVVTASSEKIARTECLELRCSDVCDFKTMSIGEFTQHAHSNHSQISSFSCFVCKSMCFKVEQLIKHYSLEHSVNEYQCVYCEHGLASVDAVRTHLLHNHSTLYPVVRRRREQADERGSYIDEVNLDVGLDEMRRYVSIVDETDYNIEEIEIAPAPQPSPAADERAVAVATQQPCSTRKATDYVVGLSGKDLYKCGMTDCTVAVNDYHEFKDHTSVCDNARFTEAVRCVHCDRTFRQNFHFFTHISTHGIPRFYCTLCEFKHTSSKKVTDHMRRHKVLKTKLQPADPTKNNRYGDLYLVVPDIDKKSRGPCKSAKWSMSRATSKTTAATTTIAKRNELETRASVDERVPPMTTTVVYSCDDIKKAFPTQQLFNSPLECGICGNYGSKVRTNMLYHMESHTNGLATSKDIVNPVPRMDKTELMFNKMTNHAAYSIKSDERGKTSTTMKIEPSQSNGNDEKTILPAFVPKRYRFSCGAPTCSYVSQDGAGLKNHFETLHRELNNFKCPHCSWPILISQLNVHPRYHGCQLYKCPLCDYCHYTTWKVEDHVRKEHDGKSLPFQTVRNLNPAEEERESRIAAAVGQTNVAKAAEESTQWRCHLCRMGSATSEHFMRIHCETNHGLKDAYKCSLCAFSAQEERAVQQHMRSEHHNVSQVVITVYSMIEPLCPERSAAPAATCEHENNARSNRNDEATAVEASTVASSDNRAREDDATAYVTPLVLPYRNDFFRCGRCSFRTKLLDEMRGHLNEEIAYVRYSCSTCGDFFYWEGAMKAHSAKHPQKQYDDSGDELTFTEITRDIEDEKRVENTLRYQLEKMKRGEYSNGVFVSRAVETNGPRKCSTDANSPATSSVAAPLKRPSSSSSPVDDCAKPTPPKRRRVKETRAASSYAEPILCKWCGATFDKPGLLDKHEQLCYCHDCKVIEEESDAAMYARHRRAMHEKFACIFCAKSFVGENRYRYHIDEAYDCEQRNLPNSICVPSGEKRLLISCPYCDEAESTSTSLRSDDLSSVYSKVSLHVRTEHHDSNSDVNVRCEGAQPRPLTIKEILLKQAVQERHNRPVPPASVAPTPPPVVAPKPPPVKRRNVASKSTAKPAQITVMQKSDPTRPVLMVSPMSPADHSYTLPK